MGHGPLHTWASVGVFLLSFFPPSLWVNFFVQLCSVILYDLLTVSSETGLSLDEHLGGFSWENQQPWSSNTGAETKWVCKSDQQKLLSHITLSCFCTQWHASRGWQIFIWPFWTGLLLFAVDQFVAVCHGGFLALLAMTDLLLCHCGFVTICRDGFVVLLWQICCCLSGWMQCSAVTDVLLCLSSQICWDTFVAVCHDRFVALPLQICWHGRFVTLFATTYLLLCLP